MQDIKAIHIKKNCIGCNACVYAAPQLFEINDKDGKATLIGGQQKGDHFVKKIDIHDFDDLKNASIACPMKIIQLGGKNSKN